MDLEAQREVRRAVESRRQAPRQHAEILAAFENGRILDNGNTGPILLTVEATNAEGDVAPWLDDLWWTGVIRRWADSAVTVLFAPTPGALLHPVVLHHAEMLRRVEPGWRVVASAYRDDISGIAEISRVARSPYHEVRFFDQDRPGTPTSIEEYDRAIGLDELFGQIRREQVRFDRRQPALVRLPAARSMSRPSESVNEASADLCGPPDGVG
ncbi:MAG: hypothetical protein PVI86_08940 [Phycisphaerae bacterium]|jgi:hypothetical protein